MRRFQVERILIEQSSFLLIVSETRMIVRWIEYRTNCVHRCPAENKHTSLISWSEMLNCWRTSKNSNLHQKRQWPTFACRNSVSGQFYPDRYSIEHVPCFCSHDVSREESLHNDLGCHGDHPLFQLTHYFDRLNHFFFTMLSILLVVITAVTHFAVTS